mmetsp:Transcript_19954/g.23136  ORF Transcript_19954/g.23136 Transcript_19954/m.23136 type:complete len:84 (+) Transcript_19954:248-499(+)
MGGNQTHRTPNTDGFNPPVSISRQPSNFDLGAKPYGNNKPFSISDLNLDLFKEEDREKLRLGLDKCKLEYYEVVDDLVDDAYR